MLAHGQRAQILHITVRHPVARMDPESESVGLGTQRGKAAFGIVVGVQRTRIGPDRIVHGRHLGAADHAAVKQIDQLQKHRAALGIGERDQNTRIAVNRRPLRARLAGEQLLDQRQQRGHEGRKQRHNHEYDEQRAGNDPHLVTDVEHDELHQSARVHQHADRQAVLPRLADGPGRQRSAEQFACD